MAGDGLIVDPMFSGTMAVVVSARPEDIWPWLMQMGYQRGGLYSVHARTVWARLLTRAIEPADL